MLIQFCIEAFIVIIAIYYVTVFLHLFGIVQVFKKVEISFLLALIPFYYWIKRDVTV
jgi:hypothetical protein